MRTFLLTVILLAAGSGAAFADPAGLLSITTREHEKGQTARGTTLGVSAQAGVLGRIGDRGLIKASGSYLGAIVPGTGDDLGGLVLQLAAGLAFD